jgi:hypothetical protein
MKIIQITETYYKHQGEYTLASHEIKEIDINDDEPFPTDFWRNELVSVSYCHPEDLVC